MIRYIQHKDIDKKKWDTCIENAVNSLIYAYSWYLDIVSPNWDALIENDYEAVMPLTWRKKFGIKYLFKPLFTQQLGVFGKKTDTTVISDLLESIPEKFKYINITLNEKNLYRGNQFTSGFNNNFKLNINKKYTEIYNNYYNRNCRRNIEKAEKANLKRSENISADEFVMFLKNNLGDKIDELNKNGYSVLWKLINTLLDRKAAEMYAAVLPSGETCAIALHLITNKRCIFFICASNEKGKEAQSMHFLVNSQIKKYAGKSIEFDFSGSNIKGIAYFNSTFGATSEKYQTIKRNNLPGLLKLIKK